MSWTTSNPTWRLVLAACLGGFLLGAFVGAKWRPAPPDVRAWERRVTAYQRDSVEFERVVSILHGTVARLEDSARTLETRRAAAVARADVAAARGRQLGRKADSLTASLAYSRTAADSVPVLVAALDARTEEAASTRQENASLREALARQIEATGRLQVALATADQLADSLGHRLAIADDLLRDRPPTDRCRILFLPCPSRTVSFIGGAVLGGAVAAYVGAR